MNDGRKVIRRRQKQRLTEIEKKMCSKVRGVQSFFSNHNIVQVNESFLKNYI